MTSEVSGESSQPSQRRALRLYDAYTRQAAAFTSGVELLKQFMEELPTLPNASSVLRALNRTSNPSLSYSLGALGLPLHELPRGLNEREWRSGSRATLKWVRRKALRPFAKDGGDIKKERVFEIPVESQEEQESDFDDADDIPGLQFADLDLHSTESSMLREGEMNVFTDEQASSLPVSSDEASKEESERKETVKTEDIQVKMDSSPKLTESPQHGIHSQTGSLQALQSIPAEGAESSRSQGVRRTVQEEQRVVEASDNNIGWEVVQIASDRLKKQEQYAVEALFAMQLGSNSERKEREENVKKEESKIVKDEHDGQDSPLELQTLADAAEMRKDPEKNYRNVSDSQEKPVQVDDIAPKFPQKNEGELIKKNVGDSEKSEDEKPTESMESGRSIPKAGVEKGQVQKRKEKTKSPEEVIINLEEEEETVKKAPRRSRRSTRRGSLEAEKDKSELDKSGDLKSSSSTKETHSEATGRTATRRQKAAQNARKEAESQESSIISTREKVNKSKRADSSPRNEVSKKTRDRRSSRKDTGMVEKKSVPPRNEQKREGDKKVTAEKDRRPKKSSILARVPKERRSLGMRRSRGDQRVEALLSSGNEWMIRCFRIWEKIYAHSYARFFRKPVTAEEAPDYEDIIDTPMDLGKIGEDLKDGEIEDPVEFSKVMYLVCNNSMRYNPKDSDLHAVAKDLKDLMKQDIAPLLREYRAYLKENNITEKGKEKDKNEQISNTGNAPKTPQRTPHSMRTRKGRRQEDAEVDSNKEEKRETRKGSQDQNASSNRRSKKTDPKDDEENESESVATRQSKRRSSVASSAKRKGSTIAERSSKRRRSQK